MFYFGIPSYKRSKEQLTLIYLSKLGYSKERIILSTQTQEDYDEYKKLYKEVATIIFYEGNCVGDNRNNILKFLPLNSNIVMLDDDIKSLQKLSMSGKLERIDSKEELDKFIENAFNYAKTKNARIWGVYPVNNSYFMKTTIDKRNILIGCVMGLINCFKFDTSFRTKEDYELCCREMKKGYNCVRFNYITADAKHKTNSGGCKEDWKYEINKKSADMLIAKYPEMIKRNSKKLDEVRYVGKTK